mmetsp:Transcript_72112/g.127090  ORF Transcript_72112/g.127090 Transcript_72112/m.127090 type:complete len:222 (+) Transcript_72112:671-1336(+)
MGSQLHRSMEAHVSWGPDPVSQVLQTLDKVLLLLTGCAGPDDGPLPEQVHRVAIDEGLRDEPQRRVHLRDERLVGHGVRVRQRGLELLLPLLPTTPRRKLGHVRMVAAQLPCRFQTSCLWALIEWGSEWLQAVGVELQWEAPGIPLEVLPGPLGLRIGVKEAIPILWRDVSDMGVVVGLAGLVAGAELHRVKPFVQVGVLATAADLHSLPVQARREHAFDV